MSDDDDEALTDEADSLEQVAADLDDAGQPGFAARVRRLTTALEARLLPAVDSTAGSGGVGDMSAALTALVTSANAGVPIYDEVHAAMASEEEA